MLNNIHIIKKLLFLLIVCPLLTFSQEVNFSALNVDSALSQGADSVIIHEEITLDLSEEGTLKTSVYRVVTVYNKAGLSDVKAYASYNNNSKVSKIEAVIYDLLGNEKQKIKKRDFKDVSAVSGGTLYADSRIMYLDYTATSYPYTVSFVSETESKTTAFLREWMPVSRYESGTQYSQFTVIHNPENILRSKSTQLEEYDVTVEETAGKTVWTARNIAPISQEYNSPALDKRMPRVKCFFDTFYLEGVPGIAGNWKDFGKWMYDELVIDTQDLDAATIAQVQELVKDLPDEEAKARAIYQFVQDKVRYISVQVEIGGWKPMNASDVQRLSYGDCKALSSYTQSLLKAAGIKSFYTILYGDTGKESLETDVVAMQGNHAILGVQLGDSIKFLECTSQETPFGYMGLFTDDRDVLLVTEEGGKLARTTKYEQEDNLNKVSAKFILDAAGDLSGSISRTSEGIYYSARMQLDTKNDKDLKDYYYNTFDGIKNLSVSDISLQNDKLAINYKEDMNIEASGYASKINENFLIEVNPFALTRDAIPPRYVDRKSNFIILRGTVQKQEVEIALPQNFTVNSLPEDIEITEEFASYKATYKIKEGMLYYTRILKLNEGEYSVGVYNAYRDFYKNCVRLDGQKLLIETK
ncbi:DUF3857 domain-containing protein [Leeuwenhoekiella sp. NPDC079379]|uniref:DUF3857 domain-containing protein n=1 Tax=Leeuwenhoekiella sp. NPDC079379 TaxID=3364122 RepID=UPI0037C569B7